MRAGCRHISAAALWLFAAALSTAFSAGCRAPPIVAGDADPGEVDRPGDPSGGDAAMGDTCRPWEPCARGDEDCCWCRYERLSTTGTYADYPDIDVDSAGKYHAVWNQSEWQDVANGNHAAYKIVYTKQDEVPVQVSDSGDRWVYLSALALGPDDRPHVVWANMEPDPPPTRFATSYIQYTNYDGQSWRTPQTLSDESRRAVTPEVAVDANNIPYVVVSESNTGYPWAPEFYLAVMPDGTSYQKHAITTASGASYPFIAVVSNGHILVFQAAWIVEYNGTSWSEPTILSDDPMISHGYAQAVALDSIEEPHFIWTGRQQEDSSIINVYYSFREGGSWTTPFCVTPDANRAAFAGMALDGRDRPHVVWQEYGEDACSDHIVIWYRHLDGASWTRPKIISRCFDPVTILNRWYAHWGPDIAIGPDDVAHVVWEWAQPGLNYIQHTSCKLDMP